jgi:hypothetical protein
VTDHTWEKDRDRGWRHLRENLHAWLAAEPAASHVIIEIPWPDDEIDGAAPYVQLAVGDGEVRTEAVSNAFLDPRFRLDAHREARLAVLGWAHPTATMDEGTTNFWRDDDLPAQADTVADRLVDTLRDVYGVPDPTFLVVGGFTGAGPLDQDDLPQGLRLAPRTPPPVDCTTVLARDADELRDLAAEVVCALTGADVEFDEDGDIPVPTTASVVYVRVEEDTPSIRLFALVLHDVRWTPRVGAALNRANRHSPYGRVTYQDGHVLLGYQIYCRPFVPELLKQAVVGMCALVDDLAAPLQRRIGGRLASDVEDGAA